MSQNGSAAQIGEEGRLLASLLEIEDRNYRRLLRLAWRQNSYLRRQDVDRLAANAGEWGRYLPRANEARIARERFVDQLARGIGLGAGGTSLGDLLAVIDPGSRRVVERALGGLRRTAAELARQNELNRHLAAFCLDLAREETEIFKRCVLTDPTGCYDGTARRGGRGPGGVLVRQA